MIGDVLVAVGFVMGSLVGILIGCGIVLAIMYVDEKEEDEDNGDDDDRPSKCFDFYT